ncbi:beta-glucosidase (glycoside hydrolase family 1 protein) [Candidatus Sulfopaludibacter sp. SbA3]|nr:beta-glucosidase (glycoside hydrolase family 1 protein) [Candidatus Sulfopaludibacter sp. SbA3]
MNEFPPGFLWGAATAAHQVEGNNTNSDLWLLEHIQPTLFQEPSLDACDHYHRFHDDIRMLAGLGLNTYRFSVEWARVEPERNHFSTAALDHYRRVLAACHENGVTPMLSFYHFSSPRWFAAMGGWEKKPAADLFVRFCERAARHLGDLTTFATTFNEPNIPMLLRWISNIDIPFTTVLRMKKQAAKAVGTGNFGCFFLGDADKLQEVMIGAHHRARAAMKSGPGDYPVGVSIALQDEQAVGPKSRRDRKCDEVYGEWLRAAALSDFVGVQSYTRCRVGKSGDMGPEPGVELTQMGYEFWPEALEVCVRYAHARCGEVPIYITENGVSTEDDSRRVEYIRRALTGLLRCLADGIDVRGYIHWSLLDNFEWIMGYRPKFGLISVDRVTQEREVKPSAHYLGAIARGNRIPDLAAIR